MKKFLLIIPLLLVTSITYAQLYLKTEYIGKSEYRDDQNQRTGGKGDLKVIEGGAQLPLSVKMGNYERPQVWGLALGASYSTMNNQGTENEIPLSELFNAQLALIHMRPISQRWTFLATAGVGLYTDAAKLSSVGFDHLLGMGGVLWIRHYKNGIDLGGGVAVNNSFGYPMLFPAICFNWKKEGKYEINISLMNAYEISTGVKVHDKVKLKAIFTGNAMLAMVEKEGKKQMFTQQYMVGGLQGEFFLTRSLSVPVTAGVSATREAYCMERKLNVLFKSFSKEYQPRFAVAPYVSVALKYGF